MKMASNRRTATDPDDPFLTALDRAVLAAAYRGGIQFNIAYDNAQWRRLTGAERQDMLAYHHAGVENCQWDTMILRQVSRTRLAWSDGRWGQIPWSDAEKASERRAFQETA